MIRYYRDTITGHLLELVHLVNLRTGVFKDLDDNSRITAQFGSSWLTPLGGEG
ncbi:MAG: hypothetical protein IT558_00630 [Alphaproteobacteria bacterium]|nr:hypothetical protein [Alphaproteobacteria bacterium]